MSFTQEELDKAVKDGVESATSGLKAKNEELLGKHKKDRDALKELQDRAAALEEAQREAERKAADSSGDVEKVKAQLQKDHEREMAKLRQQVEAAQGVVAEKDQQVHKLLVDNALSAELTRAGIKGPLMDAASALIKAKHEPKVVDADGNLVAQIDGKPLADFIAGWAKEDQGKHFISAPDNSGGGAQGANGGGQATGATKGNFGGTRDERKAAIADKFNL